jgi:hypothetical protein
MFQGHKQALGIRNYQLRSEPGTARGFIHMIKEVPSSAIFQRQVLMLLGQLGFVHFHKVGVRLMLVELIENHPLS